MKQIDVTGEKFDYIDCSEGNIFFDSFSEKEAFIVKTWGVTLMHELGISEHDNYVANMSKLVFEDVAYISVCYGLYADEMGAEFFKNERGNSSDMQLQLGKRKELCDCNEYVLGGILGRYVGYGEMTIYCRGKITLLYDEKALIDASEFCKKPEKYRFPL